MKRAYFFVVVAVTTFLNNSSSAVACDLCAISVADRTKYGDTSGFSLSATEQFTAFHSLQDDGDHVPNSVHQSMTSSITQVVGRYDVSSKLGVQLNVPIIVRDFRRPEDGEVKTGSESGLGDISILALTTPYEYSSDDFNFHWGLRGGIKLPTGDTDRLKEETEEEHDHSVMHIAGDEDHEEAVPESGVHGHDLTLGTGSVDYVLGTNALAEVGRNFWSGNVQYTIRTEGDFDYRFQNDLMWDTGIGRYLVLEHDESLTLKANLSGEYKGMDIFQGNKSEDTGVNSMFLGPELAYTAGGNFSAECGIDLPLFIDNTALQLVADYRIRLGITYRF